MKLSFPNKDEKAKKPTSEAQTKDEKTKEKQGKFLETTIAQYPLLYLQGKKKKHQAIKKLGNVVPPEKVTVMIITMKRKKEKIMAIIEAVGEANTKMGLQLNPKDTATRKEDPIPKEDQIEKIITMMTRRRIIPGVRKTRRRVTLKKEQLKARSQGEEWLLNM